MPTILLIGATTHSIDIPNMVSFQEQFQTFLHQQNRDVSVSLCYYDEVQLDYRDGGLTAIDCHNGGVPIESYDLVFFKGSMTSMYVPYILSHYLEEKGVPHINDYQAYRRLNKLVQLTHATRLGIPTPRTLYVENRRLLAEAIAKDWQFPLVLKSTTGSMGRNNHLVQDKAALEQILAATPDVHFLVQQHIPNDGDYRITLFGELAVVLHRKAANGSHLNNTSQGAAATHVPESALPQKVMRQARVIAAGLSMQVAGVDMIQDKNTGKFYFLEINAQPAIRGEASYEALAGLLEKTFTNAD